MGPHAPSLKVAAEHSSFPSTAAEDVETFPDGWNSVIGRRPTQHKRTVRGYDIARLKVAPASRGKRAFSQKSATRNETEALRRRRGRYRKQRNVALGGLRRRNPYGQKPTWEEMRHEVKAFREHSNYDSDQEEANAQATIRKSEHTEYEKRQEMRSGENVVA